MLSSFHRRSKGSGIMFCGVLARGSLQGALLCGRTQGTYCVPKLNLPQKLPNATEENCSRWWVQAQNAARAGGGRGEAGEKVQQPTAPASCAAITSARPEGTGDQEVGGGGGGAGVFHCQYLNLSEYSPTSSTKNTGKIPPWLAVWAHPICHRRRATLSCATLIGHQLLKYGPAE